MSDVSGLEFDLLDKRELSVIGVDLLDAGADIVDIGRAILDAPLWDLHVEVRS